MLIFAHRGVSGHHTDNSIPAFEHAVGMNLPIEMDVQLSCDGIFYVYHDFYIKELGKFLPEATSDEIESILINGEKIPSFLEVLKLLPDDILINVEIKKMGADSRVFTEELYAMMKRYHDIDNIIVSSFNHDVLYSMRQLDENLKIGMLFDQVVRDFPDYISRSQIKPTSMHLGVEVISKALCEQLHTIGYPVYIYTINTKEALNRVAIMGVDGVFTNYPERMAGFDG